MIYEVKEKLYAELMCNLEGDSNLKFADRFDVIKKSLQFIKHSLKN